MKFTHLVFFNENDEIPIAVCTNAITSKKWSRALSPSSNSASTSELDNTYSLFCWKSTKNLVRSRRKLNMGKWFTPCTAKSKWNTKKYAILVSGMGHWNKMKRRSLRFWSGWWKATRKFWWSLPLPCGCGSGPGAVPVRWMSVGALGRSPARAGRIGPSRRGPTNCFVVGTGFGAGPVWPSGRFSGSPVFCPFSFSVLRSFYGWTRKCFGGVPLGIFWNSSFWKFRQGRVRRRVSASLSTQRFHWNPRNCSISEFLWWIASRTWNLSRTTKTSSRWSTSSSKGTVCSFCLQTSSLVFHFFQPKHSYFHF